MMVNEYRKKYSIPSPYNFVPLSEMIFFPPWAELVTYDVPFAEGISGSLDVTLTAKTPIYIRDGGNYSELEGKMTEENQLSDYFSFFNFSGKGDYAIPGTSLKGMLRNIVEIISFGKIGPGVDDKRFGFRDLTDKQYRKTANKSKAGWLVISDDQWIIEPCDYAYVKHKDLSRYSNQNIELGKDQGSAEEKYKKWGEDKLNIDFSYRKDKKIADRLGTGSNKGVLVFTGQPGASGESEKTKKREFIFFKCEKKRESIVIKDRLKKEFLSLHSDEKGRFEGTWKYWFDKVRDDSSIKIPVFYTIDGDNARNSSMGLTKMYRLFCYNSVRNAIENSSPEHLEPAMYQDPERCEALKKTAPPQSGKIPSFKPDMAQLIFGYANVHGALKGRVQVEHFERDVPSDVDKTDNTNNTGCVSEKVVTVLNGPKASYYPNYLEQKIDEKGNVQLKTYRDRGVKIRGWKRYPVQGQVNETLVRKGAENTNQDIKTTFRPLKAGTSFSGKIHFHNLLPEELGALVWALTWGGDKRLRHNLGMGKPAGYGMVKIEVPDFCLKNNQGTEVTKDSLIKAFEEMMKIFQWSSSPQVKALKAMADPERGKKKKIAYPQLEALWTDNSKDNNEFVFFKNNRFFLKDYENYEELPENLYVKIEKERKEKIKKGGSR